MPKSYSTIWRVRSLRIHAGRLFLLSISVKLLSYSLSKFCLVRYPNLSGYLNLVASPVFSFPTIIAGASEETNASKRNSYEERIQANLEKMEILQLRKKERSK